MEVIVVDDGSTDGTQNRLKNNKDPRVQPIYLQENRRYHPRNIALSMARGKYIAFQNSDDKWKEGKLKKQLEVLEKDSHIAACFTGVAIIDEKGKQLSHSWANNIFTQDNRSSASWLRHFFDSGNCLCISSAVVRGDKMKAVGPFKASLIQLGDFDLWIRLAAAGEFYIVGEELTFMRTVADQNVSKPSPSACRRSNIEFIECLGRYLEPPVWGRLGEVFPDVLPKHEDSEIATLGGLALHAWKLTALHVWFGNRIIAEIIDDHSNREELARIFSTDIIHQYIKNRGQIDISKYLD